LILRRLLFTALLALPLAALAAGGEVPPRAETASNANSTLAYDREYFEQYRPITALDMLRWIPGVADIVPQDGSSSGSDQRGFGSGGDQVLLNGKRLSGKSNDIAAALARIQAQEVERVEVIRGTASGLDVRSEGLLVNVILMQGARRSSGSWQIHAGDYAAAGVLPDGLVSYSSGFERFSYLASLEYGPYNRADTELRDDLFVPADPAGPVERIRRTTPERQADLRFNTSGSWQINASDELNLNGQVVDKDRREEQSIERTVEGDFDSEEAIDVRTVEGTEWELGGDLLSSFGAGQLKIRAIVTRDAEVEEDIVSVVSVTPTDEVLSTRISTDRAQGETIVRSSYLWSPTVSQRLEAGLEAAVNTLDKRTSLFDELADGSIVEVPLFNASGSVEEERYEAFATHFWTLSDATLLESALNVEWSTLQQQGADVGRKRSFRFLKPRFDFRHDINTRDQLRVSLERIVSQLDFDDFVVEFDRDNDLIRGGNPDLEPEKTWRTAVTYEHRLRDDRGLLSGRAFHDVIDDHIGRVLSPAGLSAAGNIGDATRYGIELKGSWRLELIGIPGAVLDVVYTWQETETTDPFTLEQRRISDEPRHDVDLKFRHDIPSLKLNYLFDYRWRSKRYEYDVDYIDTQTDDSPRMNLTAQYQVTPGLLFFVQLRSLAGIDRLTIRERYDGTIADGNLDRVERRFRSFRQEVIAGFRGQF
jgi:outer membrane receptor protein involved in Fe transport